MGLVSRAKTKLIGAMPDRLFLHLMYYKYEKSWLNLRNPRKYTEKIQWLKLYGGLEDYAEFADKYAVREYVASKLGENYLIPLIGVWDKFEDIPFDKLPRRFVLKATHGCGYNFICKDKSKIDLTELEATFDGWMSENFYKQEREPQYKNIVPRIVCEKYIEDATGELTDYKIFCSKGEPKLVEVHMTRFSDHRSQLFDAKWNEISSIQLAGEIGKVEDKIDKPKSFYEMLRISKILAADFPFVRVDLYECQGEVYFGELTFTSGSGFVEFEKPEDDFEFDRLLDIDLAAFRK